MDYRCGNTVFSKLKNLPYKEYNIAGGEPLAVPELLKRVILRIRNELHWEKRIDVLTNGLNLTPNLVNFFNKYKVDLSISTGLQGYKNLLTLSDKCTYPSELISMLQDLKYKRFHIVINKGNSFYSEAILLHRLFNADVEYAPDILELPHYTEKDIDFIRDEIEKIKLYSKDLQWFNLLRATNNYCGCKLKEPVITTDGEFVQMSVLNETMYGCYDSYYRLGPKLYNYYCNIVSDLKYYNHKECNDVQSVSGSYKCGL